MLSTPPMSDGFPLDIFVANVSASFLLGYATGHHRGSRITKEQILLFGTAGLGGMSTFSSFTFGAISEFNKPDGLWISIVYVLASITVGFIAVYLGMKLAEDRKVD